MIIERCIVEVRGAVGINKKTDAIRGDYFVAGVVLIERHLVLQPRATAFRDLHAQTFAFGVGTRLQENAQLAHRFVGYM